MQAVDFILEVLGKGESVHKALHPTAAYGHEYSCDACLALPDPEEEPHGDPV